MPLSLPYFLVLSCPDRRHHAGRLETQDLMIKRRDFFTLIGGATFAASGAARAQQPAMRVIGFLSSRSPAEAAGGVAEFRQGVAEIGFVEGQNLAIEYRWAEGHYDRLPAFAVDLVGRKVDLIAATGG